MNEMIKLELHTSDKGFEWTDKNQWSGTTKETLHPIGDPTYNKAHIKEVEEDFAIWSDYLKCQKGRYEAHKKTNLINFANKYGFDGYLPIGKTNLPSGKDGVYLPTFENIFIDMENLKKANDFYEKSGTLSADALRILEIVNYGVKTRFTKEGIELVCSNTISAIWLSWHMSVVKGNMKVCSVCAYPFYTKRSQADTCSGGCRNKKTEFNKGEK